MTTAIKILGANHRIIIEAFDDPKVEGVACFISRARTGGISGSLGLAEDTSDASIDCAQTGPVKFREELEDGEEVFSRRASLALQAHPGGPLLRQDPERAVYLTYSDKLIDGLAEEQRVGGGDPRLAVTAVLYRAAGAGHAGRRRPGAAGAGWRRRWRSRRRRWPPTAAATWRCRAARGSAPSSATWICCATPARLRAAGVPLHAIAEQDSTDLEKCLCSVEAPLFIGLGFLGGRVDHQLAAMNALAQFPGKRGAAARRRATSASSARPRWSSRCRRAPGSRSFRWRRLRGRVSQGLRWPVDGLAFAPDGRIGTSNRALGGPVRIGFDAAAMLVILPAGRLRAAVAALARPD